jgi:hypothetical protein
MDITVAHGNMAAAFKHGFSFGGTAGTLSAVAALAILAVDHSDTQNENAATNCQPSPYFTDLPLADFPVPHSVCEMDTNPLTFGRACSPFGCDGAFDIDDVDEGRNPMEGQGLPDEDNIQEINNMIDLPYDTLINTFNNLDQER